MKFSKVSLIILFAVSLVHLASGYPLRKNIFAEYHLLPDKDGFQLSIVYRISYNALIFSKSENGYLASYSIAVERSDTADGFIDRDIVERSVRVPSIEETQSNTTLQGLLKYRFSGKKEKVLVAFSDASGGREINKYHFLIEPPRKPDIFSDISVVEMHDKADSTFTLANYNGVLPFSIKDYSLVILADSGARSKEYLRLSSKDTVFFLKRDAVVPCRLLIDSSRSGITLKLIPDSSGKFVYSVFNSANRNLLPGGYSLSLTEADSNKKIPLPLLSVFWLDKPRSLDMKDFAYRIMEKIDKAFLESPYYKKTNKSDIIELLQVWKPLDPTPETSFNERFAEFFRRVDYAIEHFSSIKGFDGAETDRGEMYIRLGNPIKIERNTTRSGKIAEIWKYDDSGKEFIFVDIAGNGTFELMEQK